MGQPWCRNKCGMLAVGTPAAFDFEFCSIRCKNLFYSGVHSVSIKSSETGVDGCGQEATLIPKGVEYRDLFIPEEGSKLDS